jgi:protocatechuate 3,4-dioxygenase beta subunit
MRGFILFFIFVCVSVSARADDLKKPDRCIAPEIELKGDEAKYPGIKVIKNTSNLRRKTGMALTAAGDRIYFTGKIVDSDCVPVPEAFIEVWHADSVGAYSFKMGDMKPSKDREFAGAGRTTTNNEGEFSFLTIFPGNYKNRAPHINFRITHPFFNETVGAVFFEYHSANDKDPVLVQYKAANQPPLVAEKRTPGSEERMTDRNYFVKIVLKGRSAFRRF